MYICFSVCVNIFACLCFADDTSVALNTVLSSCLRYPCGAEAICFAVCVSLFLSLCIYVLVYALIYLRAYVSRMIRVSR